MAYFRCDVPHAIADDSGQKRWLNPGEVFEADSGSVKARVENGYLFPVDEAAFLAWKAKNIPPVPRMPEPVLPPKIEGLNDARNSGNAGIQNTIPKAGHDYAERENRQDSTGRNAHVESSASESPENDKQEDPGQKPEEDEEKPSRQIPKPRVIKGR